MKATVFAVLCIATCVLAAEIPLRPEHPVFAGKRRSPKIVGGSEATPHSIPFQAALFLGGSFCGGSLISQRWVLTAAHCGELTTRPQVVLGAHRVQDSESTQVILTGSRVIVHPNWNPNTLSNDIALIQLPQNAPLNSNIAAVALAPSNAGDYSNQNAQASGWGLAYDGATTISPVLRYVVSTVLTNSRCQSLFGSGIPISGSIICLDGSAGKSTCSGDSGGPLVVSSGSQLVQVGLTSFGVSIGCEKGYPAAFTRVSSFASWIASNAT